MPFHSFVRIFNSVPSYSSMSLAGILQNRICCLKKLFDCEKCFYAHDMFMYQNMKWHSFVSCTFSKQTRKLTMHMIPFFTSFDRNYLPAICILVWNFIHKYNCFSVHKLPGFQDSRPVLAALFCTTFCFLTTDSFTSLALDNSKTRMTKKTKELHVITACLHWHIRYSFLVSSSSNCNVIVFFFLSQC